MCKSVIHVWRDETPTGVSHLCVIYPQVHPVNMTQPTSPQNHTAALTSNERKEKRKKKKKTASDCYRSTSHNFSLHSIISWMDSLKLLRNDFSAKIVSDDFFFPAGETQTRRREKKKHFHI